MAVGTVPAARAEGDGGGDGGADTVRLYGAAGREQSRVVLG